MSTYPLITAVLRSGTNGILVPTAQPLSVPRGESLTQPFKVVDDSGNAVNLSASSVIASIGPLNGPAAISRQATITDAVGGLGSFTLTDTETNLSQVPNWWDLELVDASGNTSKIVLQSLFIPFGGVYTPGQVITPLPSQLPLGQWPIAWGVIDFAGDIYTTVTLATAIAAANVAGTVIDLAVKWPSGTDPSTLALVFANAVPIVDGSGNMTGFYVVPSVAGTFSV